MMCHPERSRRVRCIHVSHALRLAADRDFHGFFPDKLEMG